MSVIRKLLLNKNITNRALRSTIRLSSSSSTNDTNKNILYSDIPDVEIPKDSLDEYVLKTVDKWPKSIAVECPVTGRKYTYEQLRALVTFLSRNLRKKLKLQKDDVIAIHLPNCPEYVLVVLGAIKAGLKVTTLNPVYTPDEISRQLNDSSTKALVTLMDLYPIAKKSVSLTGKQIPILTLKSQPGQSFPEGAINFEEFLEKVDYPDLPPSKTDEVALLLYSSGTTGLPKGVELTHRNMVGTIKMFDAVGVVPTPTADYQPILPGILPSFHVYGLMSTTLNTFYKGALTLPLYKFAPELYVAMMRKYKPDIHFVVPPIVLFLAAHPMVKPEDLHCIDKILSGAAPMGAIDEQRFLAKAKKDITVIQGYGLTETCSVVTMTRPDLRHLPTCSGSIGRGLPNTAFKIVNPEDPNLTPLGPNENGELLIKGPQVMKSYYNNPVETAQALTPDGWLRTGDLMCYTEDRLLVVKDRLKELIKVKGYQVPPAELEEIIRHYPDIADAAVIGVDHPTLGEVPKAFIALKPGVNQKIDTDKLSQFVAEKVAEYKQLRGGVQIIDAIPKNAAGKILRRELKEKYQK